MVITDGNQFTGMKVGKVFISMRAGRMFMVIMAGKRFTLRKEEISLTGRELFKEGQLSPSFYSSGVLCFALDREKMYIYLLRRLRYEVIKKNFFDFGGFFDSFPCFFPCKRTEGCSF